MKRSITSHRKAGFTIVELIVVILIIAILATITIISYSTVTQNAKFKTVQTDAAAIASQLTKYKAENGAYPASLDELEDQDTIESTYQYDYDAIAGTYCVTASVDGASAYIKNVMSTPKEGGCPGHGVNGLPPVTNIAINPGAEADLGWFSINNTTHPRVIDTTVRRTGAQSIRTAPQSASTLLLPIYSSGAPISSGFSTLSSTGGTYSHSIYFRSDVEHYGRLGIRWYMDGAWSSLSYAPNITGTPGEWTRATQTFELPAGTTYVRPYMYVYANSSQPAGTPAWVDDYMLVEGSDMPGYADGSFDGWKWTGAPNDSPSIGPAL